MRPPLAAFAAVCVCLSVASCIMPPRRVPTESMASVTRPPSPPPGSTTAGKPSEAPAANPDGSLQGPPAKREMDARRPRIVRSSIGHEDGNLVVAVYYDDGAYALTKDAPWGKVYEFHPAGPTAAPTPPR